MGLAPASLLVFAFSWGKTLRSCPLPGNKAVLGFEPKRPFSSGFSSSPCWNTQSLLHGLSPAIDVAAFMLAADFAVIGERSAAEATRFTELALEPLAPFSPALSC